MADAETNHWTAENASALYSIPAWSDDLFQVNESGLLCAQGSGAGTETTRVPLSLVVAEAQKSGLRLPMLLRFPGILRQRALRLQGAFARAAEKHGLSSDYTAVYPIKVNQQRTVVKTLADVPDMGLEAGSKPELIAVLAHARPGQTVVCNGYKDREYMRLALMGQRLGMDVHLVVEKPHELEMVLEQAERLGIEPQLGLRLRLSASSGGNWQSSGGERAKFGLSASQLLDFLRKLKARGKLDCLGMLHFHMGSQIPNLRDLQRGLAEAGRYLTEVSRAGADIRYLNVGGGLGVDYEGTRSRSSNSTNYDAEAYADMVTRSVAELCRKHDLAPPRLLTESGRWLTAHHAVLVTHVVASENMQPPEPEIPDSAPAVIRQMAELMASDAPAEEVVLDAEHYLEVGRGEFLVGDLDLVNRALLDRLYLATLVRIRQSLSLKRQQDHELLERLNEKLAGKLFINASIFQSLPDIWGLEQVFPVVPLQRLNESPSQRAVLEDLTCDSDGRIDRFAGPGGVERTLAVHADAGADYLLGIFMAGAYQETLGDIHNLFGDTDSADVLLDDGEIVLEHVRSGDEAGQLLASVGHTPEDLRRELRRRVSSARLSSDEARLFEATLKSGLSGYTYLEVEAGEAHGEAHD